MKAMHRRSLLLTIGWRRELRQVARAMSRSDKSGNAITVFLADGLPPQGGGDFSRIILPQFRGPTNRSHCPVWRPLLHFEAGYIDLSKWFPEVPTDHAPFSFVMVETSV